MIQPRYILKRIRGIQYKEMFRVVKRVAKKSGRLKTAVFFDMIGCIIKHETGFSDYEVDGLYAMSEADRARYLSIGRNNRLTTMLNAAEGREYMENKVLFNTKFASFLKRDWVPVDEAHKGELSDFCKKHTSLIAKPANESGGTGIFKMSVDENTDVDALYNELVSKGIGLIEEVVSQCSEMSALCSSALNTLRVVTIINNSGKAVIADAGIRFGQEGKPVDNYHSGGLSMILDTETGVAITDGRDIKRRMFKTHPITGIPLKGFQVPYWDRVIDFVKQAAAVMPNMRYIGWDVGIMEGGVPCLIEGNSFPGQDAFQNIELNIGTYDAFTKILNS